MPKGRITGCLDPETEKRLLEQLDTLGTQLREISQCYRKLSEAFHPEDISEDQNQAIKSLGNEMLELLNLYMKMKSDFTKDNE